MPQKLLSTKSVIDMTSLSRATLWRKVQAGEFPKPISISTSRVAFLADEVEKWIANLVNAQRGDSAKYGRGIC